jgi:nitroreductase
MHRVPEHPIDPLFIERWSARAMSGEDVTEQELMSLFEAAKWAPSSRNEQPWRFVYARKGTQQWDSFFATLSEGNKEWNRRAAVLIAVISKATGKDGHSNSTHAFSTGSAFQNLALQGHLLGLVVHPMGGFDAAQMKGILALPEEYEMQIMVSVGKPGKKEDLSEKDRAREIPSSRKLLHETVFENEFRP